MRTTFVLIMVLAFATSAQAALSLDLSATTVAVANTVTLSIYGDSTAPWTGDLILSEDTYLWTDPIAADYGDIISGDGWRDYTYPAVYHISYPGGTAGIQFAIEIISVQVGTIYIDLQDAFGNEMANGPLTILSGVPEPMTITLLALGGLMICRRGKK